MELLCQTYDGETYLDFLAEKFSFSQLLKAKYRQYRLIRLIIIAKKQAAIP